MLHVTIGVALLVGAVRFGDWRRWKDYYPTLLYIVAMNLLYKFFALHEFYLWELQTDGFLLHTSYTVCLWHIFVINPAFTFLFLSHFPGQTIGRGLRYIAYWVTACAICEAVMYHFGFIHYANGWSYGWTVMFQIIMFSMLRFHYKNSTAAISLSIFFTLFFLLMFGYI